MATIRISLPDTALTATLNNSVPAQDFLALLPLTLTLTDFNGTEKVSDLPETLSTQGAPEGFKPEEGDLTYYAPWGNLAIFYRDFAYSEGLVKLGRIKEGVETLKGSVPVWVTIEQITQENES